MQFNNINKWCFTEIQKIYFDFLSVTIKADMIFYFIQNFLTFMMQIKSYHHFVHLYSYITYFANIRFTSTTCKTRRVAGSGPRPDFPEVARCLVYMNHHDFTILSMVNLTLLINHVRFLKLLSMLDISVSKNISVDAHRFLFLRIFICIVFYNMLQLEVFFRE